MPTDDFNLIEATTLPEDLVPFSSIDTTPNLPPTIERVISDQLWSVAKAIEFIEIYRKGLRDPQIVSETIEALIKPTMVLGLTSDDLTVLYDESSERRLEIELSSISEDVYKTERDPKNLQLLVVELLEAIGIEVSRGTDLTEEELDESPVRTTDPIVSEAEEEAIAINPQEAEAARIAAKLGLEASVPAGEGQHVVIEEPYEVDSTDPYVQKIKGW